METKEEKKPQQAEMVVAQRTSMEVAEIESQIATAKRYPRDIHVFKEKLMAMANIDQETAESCYYALPRAGKAVDGPSIRLAEIAYTCYGNCVAQADVTHEDGKFIYATGMCRDLESNTAVRMTVRRRITYGPKHRFKPNQRYDDDLIAVTANAACAIAFRNAVFKIVPGAFIKPVFDKCKRTAVGKAVSLAARVAEVMKRIQKFGVAQDRVLAVLGCKCVEEVTFEGAAILIGLGTAIKDGDTTVEEAFPPDFKEAQKLNQDEINSAAGSQVTNTPFDEDNPETKAEAKKQVDKLKEEEDWTRG